MNKYAKQLGDDEIIPIWWDNCFKLIFGDSTHLERINLLLSIILNREVSVIELLDTELIEDNRMDKKNTVDLVSKLDGEYVSIEVNSSFGSMVKNRNLSFLFRVESKELKPGDSYNNISKYYQINLNQVDFDGQAFNTCSLRSDNTGIIYSDLIKIYNINLKYYAEVCYNTINKEELSVQDKVLGTIGTNKKSLIETLTKDNKILKEIGDIVKKFSEDEHILVEYNREKLMMDDMKQVLTEEVTKKTTLEIARKMKQAGSDANFISEVTGLSIEEINEL